MPEVAVAGLVHIMPDDPRHSAAMDCLCHPALEGHYVVHFPL